MTMSLVNLCAFVRRVPLRQSAMKALRLAIGFECEPLLRGPTMGGVMVSTTTASEQSTMSMKEKAMFESTFLNFLIGGEKFRRWRLSMRILKNGPQPPLRAQNQENGLSVELKRGDKVRVRASVDTPR